MESAVLSCLVLVAFMLEQGSKDTCRVVVGLSVCGGALICDRKRNGSKKIEHGKEGSIVDGEIAL